MIDEAESLPQPRFLHGTRQIIEFNWPRYLAAACVVAAGGLLAARTASIPLRAFLVVGLLLTAWWSLASLFVSWWVYDASGLTRWTWLSEFVDAPKRWLNVHAGFDETTDCLRSAFPTSNGDVVDLFDPNVTTEASIARARRRTTAYPPAPSGSCDHLPAADGAYDAVFLLFAAHEFRKHEQRVALFREAARVLNDQGVVVLVEHLRDTANFAAFGPGFTHFQPRRAWTQAARAAGLTVRVTRSFTPFVAVYIWEKRP